MTTAHEALRQCVEAMKLVNFVDCAESEELWHKLNAAQQVAEEVLRNYVPQSTDVVPRQMVREAIADLFTRMNKSYAAEPTRRITFMDLEAAYMHVKRLGVGGCLDAADEIIAGMKAGAPVVASVATQQTSPNLPSTPQEVVAFIGPHFEVREEEGAIEDRRFTLSVHDLLSAFHDWFDLDEVGGQPAAAVPDNVLKAAIAWWEACRPAGWSEASHIEHPSVNTLTESGNALGKAVAAHLSAQKLAAAPNKTSLASFYLLEDGLTCTHEVGYQTIPLWCKTTADSYNAMRIISALYDRANIPAAAPSGDAWISVDDQLPEVGQGVIAYRPTASQTQDSPITITFYTNREHESWQGVKHQFDCLCHPTHWLPLPPAPTATKE